MHKHLIGLTGMYCSGKNVVAALLERRGIPVLDVDKLGHRATENQKAAVFSRFGADLQGPDGAVNRKLLGERVFGKGREAELAALEAIVHPEVNRLTGEWLAAQTGEACAINAALLHKTPFFGQMDALILVTAPFLTRLLRAKKRDALSWAAILQRFASQKKFTAQYLAGNADIYKVENRGLSQVALRRYSTKMERRLDEIVSGVCAK